LSVLQGIHKIFEKFLLSCLTDLELCAILLAKTTKVNAGYTPEKRLAAAAKRKANKE